MDNSQHYIICMVGLPGRGKSYLSKKMARYLNWVGLKSKIFNIGVYRRTLIGVNCDCTFFDQQNSEALKARESCCFEALNDLVYFLSSNTKFNLGDDENGQIAILDGTNTRIARRRMIEKYLNDKMTKKFSLIWVESICTLEKVIEQNIIATKLKSQDYYSWNPEEAVNDFRKRIQEYEKVYEAISKENDGPETIFIKLINQNIQIEMRNLKGYLPSKLLSYLINLHTVERPIYFSRHGESEDNVKNIIGGDSSLSELGKLYGESLKQFFIKESKGFHEYTEKPKVFCSTLKRSIETSEYLSFLGKKISIKALDELNVGICDGLSYEEIKIKYPKDYEERMKDKLRYRYTRGESYMDMIIRMEQIIFELERHWGPVIVIGHQGILRCLYGYFALAPIEEIPTIDFPLNTLIKFIPQAYGFNEERYNFNLETGEIVKLKDIKQYKDTLIHKPEHIEMKKTD